MVKSRIMAKFNPELAAVPDTDFTDKNAVDRFLNCGKFRRCANLKAPHARLPGATVYLPVCTKSRFDRKGVAALIEMPEPRRPLEPFTYTTLAVWAPLISCPRDCCEYERPASAKVKRWLRQSLSWVSQHLIKPSEILWAAFWAWLFR